MNADDILNTLADLLADRVAARLSARPAIYSSTALPPGITRRTFHARCRTIPEAVRDGRVWRCPVDAYERAVRTPAPVVPIRRPKPDTVALLAASGISVKGR